MKKLPDLSATELELLQLLWDRGGLAAREIHARVGKRSGWAYTTTRTTLDRMVQKKLLRRRDSHGIFLYEPRISKPLGLARYVREFAKNVLELNQVPVVSLFAGSDALTEEELAELARILKAPAKPTKETKK